MHGSSNVSKALEALAAQDSLESFSRGTSCLNKVPGWVLRGNILQGGELSISTSAV